MRAPDPSLITMVKFHTGPAELFLREILEARVALTTFSFALKGVPAWINGKRRDM